jgi:hypothetical protein
MRPVMRELRIATHRLCVTVAVSVHIPTLRCLCIESVKSNKSCTHQYKHTAVLPHAPFQMCILPLELPDATRLQYG